MLYTYDRDTAVRHLVSNAFLDVVESKYDNRASVVPINITTNTWGVMTHAIKPVSLRISKRKLIWLYKNCTSFANMEYISCLYSLGVGLPHDDLGAKFWKKQSYGGCSCPSFADYKAKLKADIKSNMSRSYYMYTDTVNDLMHYLPFEQKRGRERVAIVYKASIEGHKYHCLVTENGVIPFDIDPRHINMRKLTTEKYSTDYLYVIYKGYLSRTAEYAMPKSLNGMLESIVCGLIIDSKALSDFYSQVEFKRSDVVCVKY